MPFADTSAFSPNPHFRLTRHSHVLLPEAYSPSLWFIGKWSYPFSPGFPHVLYPSVIAAEPGMILSCTIAVMLCSGERKIRPSRVLVVRRYGNHGRIFLKRLPPGTSGQPPAAGECTILAVGILSWRLPAHTSCMCRAVSYPAGCAYNPSYHVSYSCTEGLDSAIRFMGMPLSCPHRYIRAASIHFGIPNMVVQDGPNLSLNVLL